MTHSYNLLPRIQAEWATVQRPPFVLSGTVQLRPAGLTRWQSAEALDGACVGRINSQRSLEALHGALRVTNSCEGISHAIEDRRLGRKHLRVQLENLQGFLVFSMLQKLP